ncbi:MAG: TonB-dependent receptor [Bacteroidetes bacterium]|nr:TonB-dependent receptor [Bacteroidota bacterium]
MKTSLLIILTFFCFGFISAQEKDSLKLDKNINLDEIVVTATQTLRKIKDIPAQVDVITTKQIEDFPINNVDDILKSSANVYVNRSWGIFSKNAAVTMRGLESSARTLILVDGVPKNKIAGGSVNWHNINPENIERIEIIKGSASALYGNNAMGGVINIITKKPKAGFSGNLKTYYGTYNTIGSTVNISNNNIVDNKGFYWDLSGYFRDGDGYNFTPVEFMDETDVKVYLKELGGGTKLGYSFNKSNNIEVVYNHFDEMRGAGRKVFLNDGSYESYLTDHIRAKYDGKIGNSVIKAIMYYTKEEYYAQKESFNSHNEYKLLDSNSDKSDKGFWFSISNKWFKKNYITIGMELKMGDVDGNEIYRTSPDIIEYESNLDIVGFFIQDEINFCNDKLKVILGVRNDIANFHSGFQSVINPSKATGFAQGFSEELKSNVWFATSPKASVQYSLNNNSKLYTSVGVGFKPPKLKDLSQTGKIRKGFRLSNPKLKPEFITTYEIGYNLKPTKKITINSAVYYSRGTDFQYLIGNGDSVDTGGSSLKPVLLTENIGKVGIMGAELSFNYTINKNLFFNANYSYNYSKLIDFEQSDINPGMDLTDKYMIEVSPNLFYASLRWKNKIVNINANCNYVDEQWYDDQNTILIEDYLVANIKFSKILKKQYKIYLDIQNIFDNEFVDRKGLLSPGRFIIGGLQYKF